MLAVGFIVPGLVLPRGLSPSSCRWATPAGTTPAGLARAGGRSRRLCALATDEPHGRLILVRHGQSEWNRANIFTGWVDVDLTEQGIAVESLLPLADVKAKFQELSQQYDAGDSSLEGEVEKWSKLLDAHPEYKQELEQEAIEWAASQEAPCAQAYEVTRSFLPVDLHRWTKEELVHPFHHRGHLACRFLRKYSD